MKSKRSNEGYIMFDHSDSPGIGAREINMIDGDLPTGMGRTMFEAPTYTCSHCERVVVLNPLRQRERPWCRKCDKYICDECGVAKTAGAECITFNEIADVIQEVAGKGGDTGIVWDDFMRRQKRE